MMGHHIRGVIVSDQDADAVVRALQAGTVVPLDGGWAFVPLTGESFDALPDVPGDGPAGFEWLTPKVEVALSHAHGVAALAWIETDYFGGVGTQAAAFYRHGRREWAEAAPTDVINRALEALGVRAVDGLDAFDTLGLGRFRSMDPFEADETPIPR